MAETIDSYVNIDIPGVSPDAPAFYLFHGTGGDEHQFTDLAAELTKFRDEELAHHDHAIEHGSRDAPGYGLLSAVIKAGCRAAIRISERV